METYVAHLRYYPGDPLEEIRQQDLDRMAQSLGVDITCQKIENRTFSDGMLREETLEKTIEEISQEVITLKAADESRFCQALAAIYDKYRSPRTPYGFWGSSREGARLAKEVADETGGGW
jgi:hypothetical protein